MQLKNGFTLIELLIAIVVVVILSAVAVNSYSRYVLKSRRSDAINALLSISQAEERYRATNTSYGTLSQVWPSTTTPQGYYNLSSSSVSATSYTLTAAAVGSQANDTENGTACSSLVLSVSNGTVTNTPAACWPS